MNTNILRLFLLLIISAASVVTHAQSKDSFQVQLSRKWINAKTYTLKMADLMPAEQYDFKPTAEVMSFKAQLLHIAQNMKWLSSSFLLLPKSDEILDTASMAKAAVINSCPMRMIRPYPLIILMKNS